MNNEDIELLKLYGIEIQNQVVVFNENISTFNSNQCNCCTTTTTSTSTTPNCCCPDETGTSCGNGCCCCGSGLAPIGPNCECGPCGSSREECGGTSTTSTTSTTTLVPTSTTIPPDSCSESQCMYWSGSLGLDWTIFQSGCIPPCQCGPAPVNPPTEPYQYPLVSCVGSTTSTTTTITSTSTTETPTTTTESPTTTTAICNGCGQSTWFKENGFWTMTEDCDGSPSVGGYTCQTTYPDPDYFYPYAQNGDTVYLTCSCF